MTALSAIFGLLVSIVIHLVPIRTRTGVSDGLWRLAAIKRDQYDDRSIAAWLLKASSIAGLRPREWNPELVKRAFGGTAVSREAKWLEYNWYADTGQLHEAAALIEWWLQQDQISRVEKAIWWYEAAWFEAFSVGNLARARERFQAAEAFKGDGGAECSEWKARAAIAAGEGRIADTAYAADRARQVLRHLPIDEGLDKGIREDLSTLLESAQVRQP
jgi:hypothetical protein